METPEIVLSQIFKPDIGMTEEHERQILQPSFEDIYSLAEVIGRNGKEEEIQKEIAQRPAFLTGFFSYGWSTEYAFLTKPLIGTKHKADFAVVTHGQGGFTVHLVEIESPSATILTKQGIPSETLNRAIKQIKDWDIWIENNKRTFAIDLIERINALPNYPNKHKNLSFSFGGAGYVMEEVERWGGIDSIRYFYTIIVGRWSKLSKKEQLYIVQENRSRHNIHNIYTFEQLIRTSLIRFYKPLP